MIVVVGRNILTIRVSIDVTQDRCPDTYGISTYAMGFALESKVIEKGAIQSGREGIREVQEKLFVEFKGRGKLTRHLPHGVDELEKDR